MCHEQRALTVIKLLRFFFVLINDKKRNVQTQPYKRCRQARGHMVLSAEGGDRIRSYATELPQGTVQHSFVHSSLCSISDTCLLSFMTS